MCSTFQTTTHHLHIYVHTHARGVKGKLGNWFLTASSAHEGSTKKAIERKFQKLKEAAAKLDQPLSRPSEPEPEPEPLSKPGPEPEPESENEQEHEYRPGLSIVLHEFALSSVPRSGVLGGGGPAPAGKVLGGRVTKAAAAGGRKRKAPKENIIKHEEYGAGTGAGT